jgi:hypothetical protein
VIVPMPHNPLLIDHDHRALRPEPGRIGAVGARDLPSTSACNGTVGPFFSMNPLCDSRSCLEIPTTVASSADKIISPIPIRAELFRADHRAVAGIEQQHDALAAVL